MISWRPLCWNTLF